MFDRALGLHQQAQFVLGEATDVYSLGEVYERQEKLKEAHASLERAVDLYRHAHFVPGEVMVIEKLREVSLLLKDAQKSEALLLPDTKLFEQDEPSALGST
ncbi:hypothetical protein H0H87_004380 [Tephrocybe sp. NHM501043]|nr:hypothetical protein H0H87_004380 [Tephrocybe sp. NHM501043]